jgi:acetyl esterase
MKRHLLFSALLVLSATPLHAQQGDRQPRVPFQQVFALPGIELSREQAAKVEVIRKQATPKLRQLQRQQNEVYTPEQRRARREALQAGRQAGKRGAELRQAVDKAVNLSQEQKDKLAALSKEQEEVVAGVHKQLVSLLTEAQQRQLRQRRQPATAPTHRNVKYGPHARNVMDVWLAKSDKPTPVLVSIHGGGFRGGNKSVAGSLLRACLEQGISVVAITYRLSGDAIAPAQFLDSARAIQFIRHNAKKWNLDPKRIAATGGSAGAGLSLWLGFHDDLADPTSKDPVLRQSSRLTCMAVYNGQSSYDPRFIRDLFPGTDTYKHPALAQLYDVDLDQLDRLPKSKYALFEECSPLHHLTKDDAPALLFYATTMATPIRSQGIGIHHPRFGQVLKKKMDELGIECRVEVNIQRGSERWTNMTMDFIKKHFGMK